MPDVKSIHPKRFRLGRARPCRWTPRRKTLFHVFWGCIRLSVWYRPWRGFYLAAVTWADRQESVVVPQPVTKGHRVKKRKPGGSSTDAVALHLAPIESNVFAKLFNLVQHCAVTRYDDGESRQPGWFTVKTAGSAWVVQVKDPDSCCSLQAIGNTLDDALALADLLLGADDAPWEVDRFLKKQEAEKRKKA